MCRDAFAPDPELPVGGRVESFAHDSEANNWPHILTFYIHTITNTALFRIHSFLLSYLEVSAVLWCVLEGPESPNQPG